MEFIGNRKFVLMRLWHTYVVPVKAGCFTIDKFIMTSMRQPLRVTLSLSKGVQGLLEVRRPYKFYLFFPFFVPPK
jgi:hypothetical protein